MQNKLINSKKNISILKRALVILILSFFTFSVTNISNANSLVSKNEKVQINAFITNYLNNVSKKYNKEKIIIKFVNIIKKIDILKINFQNRQNVANKEKILQILWIIKTEMKIYLGNLDKKSLTKNMKKKLKEVNIIKDWLADSKFLYNWIEVFNQWNNKISTAKWGQVVYFIRLQNNNLDNLSSQKNEVYLKKALWKNKKLSRQTFIARLWYFTNSDLYSIREDFTNPPTCYDTFKYYKWTNYNWIPDSLTYMSKSLDELSKKLKNAGTLTTALNHNWVMCPNPNQVNKLRWLKFDVKSWLADTIKNDITPALKTLK